MSEKPKKIKTDKKSSKTGSYISGSESRRIIRFNRKLTRKLEKQRKESVGHPEKYETKMRDENNIVEFDNVCTYFFTDIGTVKAVENACACVSPAVCPECKRPPFVGLIYTDRYMFSIDDSF